ncbi:MAG: MBL fold metallo-hydrolase [Flavobacteriaceae bacterium]
MRHIPFFLAATLMIIGCKNDTKNPKTETTLIDSTSVPQTEIKREFKVNPVSHATMVLTWDGKTIYVDPVGGAEVFSKFKKPDLILVTDIHGDHLNVETLEAIMTPETQLVVPLAVSKELPNGFTNKVAILSNGNSREILGFNIEAVPMYNLREEALKFHEKGRGNGYVIQRNGRRVYISGDTEDIPEMRGLQNIDVAFVCMNLPYTMTVEQAADAVLAFQPKLVYPYHYRGTDGLSDVAKFKELVHQGNPSIIVNQLNWYPNQEK